MDRRAQVAVQNRREPRDLRADRPSRRPSGVAEPGDARFLSVELPGAADPTVEEDDRRDPAALPAHLGPPPGGYDQRIPGAGTEHVLIEARYEPHRARRPRRDELVEVGGQYIGGVAVDLDVREPLADAQEPRAKLSLVGRPAEPGGEAVERRRPVRAEIRHDRDRRRLVGTGQAAPAGAHSPRRGEGDASVPTRSEANFSFPGERLQDFA